MRVFKLAWVLPVCASLVLSASSWADEPVPGPTREKPVEEKKKDDAPPPTRDDTPPPRRDRAPRRWRDRRDRRHGDATRVRSEKLTHDELRQRLEDMGFEPEAIKSVSGSPMNKIKTERHGWTFFFFVSLSSDQTKVWLSAPLREIPAPGKERADILVKILAKNDAIGPAHFSLKGRVLYLAMPLGNRNLTTVYLRKQMDWFMDTIRTTNELWDPSKYPSPEAEKIKEKPEEVPEKKPAPPPPPPPLPDGGEK